MSDSIGLPEPPNNDEEEGLIFDHPLLEKLDIFDRIVVTAHYATLIRNTAINAQMVALLRTINTLILVIETSDTFSNEQKTALGGLVHHLQGRMQEIVEDAQRGDEN